MAWIGLVSIRFESIEAEEWRPEPEVVINYLNTMVLPGIIEQAYYYQESSHYVRILRILFAETLKIARDAARKDTTGKLVVGETFKTFIRLNVQISSLLSNPEQH